jgi:hypothetical protein
MVFNNLPITLHRFYKHSYLKYASIYTFVRADWKKTLFFPSCACWKSGQNWKNLLLVHVVSSFGMRWKLFYFVCFISHENLFSQFSITRCHISYVYSHTLSNNLYTRSSTRFFIKSCTAPFSINFAYDETCECLFCS